MESGRTVHTMVEAAEYFGVSRTTVGRESVNK